MPPRKASPPSRLLEQLEAKLSEEVASRTMPPASRLQTTRQAVDHIASELPVHGRLLRRVQQEFEMVVRPGGVLLPQPHQLKPNHRLVLPCGYYEAELRRAEANLRISLSHGPRLRRAVRQLRLGCAEARISLESICRPELALHADEERELRLSAAREGLTGRVDPSGVLVSREVEEQVCRELDELRTLCKAADAQYKQVTDCLVNARSCNATIMDGLEAAVKRLGLVLPEIESLMDRCMNEYAHEAHEQTLDRVFDNLMRKSVELKDLHATMILRETLATDARILLESE
ncbi:hypothetical protein AB1Y20_020618 [Prymnesium parvum]|uniref:Uncharacterized protein n=1 Tax=Prymnesium parvum TaxID=97485 RepID=A0AB34JYL4_PRYPA